MAQIDSTSRATREINAEIKRLMVEGNKEISILNPGAKHNLAVAILEPVQITIKGSVGYYCGGLIDGASIVVEGSAGWGLAESMLSGTVHVHGSAGSGAAAAIRGGTVVVHGDSAARTAVSMKGGEVIILGNCGYMSGFMAQKGTLIVCGDAGEGFADSMYATVCYVGGKISSLGTDAVEAEMDRDEAEALACVLSRTLPEKSRSGLPPASQFKKVVAGRKLWNFDKREWRIWQEAL